MKGLKAEDKITSKKIFSLTWNWLRMLIWFDIYKKLLRLEGKRSMDYSNLKVTNCK
jgi:hypothetical protein